MNLCIIAADSARVAVPSGASVVCVRPVMRLFAFAHLIASCAHEDMVFSSANADLNAPADAVCPLNSA